LKKKKKGSENEIDELTEEDIFDEIDEDEEE
jgi:hypothetical protein